MPIVMSARWLAGYEVVAMSKHFLDKDGWPVERIIGRPINYLIRLLIHARSYREWSSPTFPPDDSISQLGGRDD